MAYLSQQPDDEQKQQQQGATPTLGGGATASPMTQPQGGSSPAPARTMGGGSSAAPQKSAMQGTGSNFVNLSSFLTPTVAKENTAKVNTANTTMGAAEKQTFDKAAQPLRDASFTAVTGDTKELVNSLVPTSAPVDPNAGVPPGGYKDPNTGQIWSAKDPKTGARTQVNQKEWEAEQRGEKPAVAAAPAPQNNASLTQLQSMLTQDYTGPMSVDYDANNKNAQQWSQLGNADTAINALAPQNFTENLPSAQYGQGNRWLDEALIKGDGGTMGAIGGSKAASDRFGAEAGGEVKKLEGKAKWLKEEAAAERANRRGELTAYGDEMLGGIDARAQAANEKEIADYNNRDKYVRDPATGEIITSDALAASGQKNNGNWEAGSGAVGQGATKGNTATAEERGRLSGIASLLGMDGYNVANEGTYSSGRSTTSRRDDDVAPLQTRTVNTRETDELNHAKNIQSIKGKAHKPGENNQQQLVQYVTLRKMRPDLSPGQLMAWIESGGGSEADFMAMDAIPFDENGERVEDDVGRLQVKGVM